MTFQFPETAARFSENDASIPDRGFEELAQSRSEISAVVSVPYQGHIGPNRPPGHGRDFAVMRIRLANIDALQRQTGPCGQRFVSPGRGYEQVH